MDSPVSTGPDEDLGSSVGGTERDGPVESCFYKVIFVNFFFFFIKNNSALKACPICQGYFWKKEGTSRCQYPQLVAVSPRRQETVYL